MRETGFEPVQALSYHGLNVTRLTAPASPHTEEETQGLINFEYFAG